MKPIIVKFSNRLYGIRKWTIFGYRYRDLKTNGDWWFSIYSPSFYNCQGSLKQTKHKLIEMYDYGKKL